MKFDKEDMGKRIKAARKIKNMTQEELAEALGVSVTHISHIENGKGSASIEVICHLMENLDLSPNELFCGIMDTAKPTLLAETAEILEQFSAKRISLLNRQLAIELPEQNHEEGNG